MKKILIIDNGMTENGKKNFELLLDWQSSEDLNNSITRYYNNNFTFDLIKFDEISLDKINYYDGIILSGGTNLPVQINKENLKNEYLILQNYNKPILGICYGFEVIANFADLQIEQLINKVEGENKIYIIDDDELVNGIANVDIDVKVWENHKFGVKNVNEKIKVIANSENGIEIFKLIDKPIYATQFHPEHYGCGACGKFLLQNFLEIVNKYK